LRGFLARLSPSALAALRADMGLLFVSRDRRLSLKAAQPGQSLPAAPT
jgi:hypothetical protein